MDSVDASSTQNGGSRLNRGGRPVVPDDARLDGRVSFACTLEQRDRLRAAARERALTVSEFVLQVALRAPLPRALAVTSDALQLFVALSPVIELIRADSRNLGQLVHHLNTQRVLGEGVDTHASPTLNVVQSHVQRVSALVASMLELRSLLNPPGPA